MLYLLFLWSFHPSSSRHAPRMQVDACNETHPRLCSVTWHLRSFAWEPAKHVQNYMFEVFFHKLVTSWCNYIYNIIHHIYIYDMVCKLRSGRRPLEIGFHLILAVPSFSNGKFHQLLLGDQDLQLIHECVLYMCMGQAVWSKVFKDPNMWAFITKNWKTNVLCMSILLEIGLAEQIRQSIAVSFGPFTFDNIGGFTVNSFSLWPHPTHQSCFCSIAQKHLEWDPNR